MEVKKVLHMNKGNDELSYARNSTFQGKIIRLAKPTLEDAVRGMMKEGFEEREKRLVIADLGCSSGPNTLLAVSEIVDAVRRECAKMDRNVPELSVYLNDLPSNDFNHILGSLLPEFDRAVVAKEGKNGAARLGCFVSAVAGSFYGRLFPRNSLHFVHASSCLHFLSQVPAELESGAAVNKGQIYISKTTPTAAIQAYANQFQADISSFLTARSIEMVPKGRAILSLFGRTSNLKPTDEPGSKQLELLSIALRSMAADRLVDRSKIDSFNFPYYVPSVDEVKEGVEREGSFYVDRVESFEADWDEGVGVGETKGERAGKAVRAVVEPMVREHFGGGICEELFRRLVVVADEYLREKRVMVVNLVVCLVKKD